jgi:hypothetical protein
VGDPQATDTRALLDVLAHGYHPHTVLASAPPERVQDDAATIPLLQGRQAIGGRATAYVCRNMMCQLPVHTPQELRALLRGDTGSAR